MNASPRHSQWDSRKVTGAPVELLKLSEAPGDLVKVFGRRNSVLGGSINPWIIDQAWEATRFMQVLQGCTPCQHVSLGYERLKPVRAPDSQPTRLQNASNGRCGPVMTCYNHARIIPIWCRRFQESGTSALRDTKGHSWSQRMDEARTCCINPPWGWLGCSRIRHTFIRRLKSISEAWFGLLSLAPEPISMGLKSSSINSYVYRARWWSGPRDQYMSRGNEGV